jgi:NADH-quinone oxidoreductase subunit E
MPWGADEVSAFDQKPVVKADPKPEAALAVAAPVAALMAQPTVAVITPPAAFVSAEAHLDAPKAKAAAKPKAPAKSAAKVAAEPKAAKPKVVKAKPAGPERLAGPRKGRADDLKEIEGIGPAMEKLVNGMGFYHFDQIASWSDADVALVDTEMKTFKGRITRDKWVSQAKIIVSEGLEAFRIRAKTNDY